MMTSEERAADYARTIRSEGEALERLDLALEQIAKDLQWYWGWSDGEGGYVLEKLRQKVLEAGYRWPHDPRPSAFIKKKAKISRNLSKAVFERDGYRCVTCNGYIDLCCDHIVAESKGGPTTLENLQTMCRPCNGRKGAK